VIRGNYLLAVCLIPVAFFPADAQVEQFEGKPIVDIQYSFQSLAPEDLAKAQPMRKGQPLRAADVAHAIDGLFATGRFADIVAEAEPSGNGVIVRFVTQPQWFVGGVNARGKISYPPNRGELASNGQFTLGGPFRQEDVDSAVKSISQLLQANGLYENTVTPSLEHSTEGQQVFITFQVSEGKRAKYTAPVINGNKLLSDAVIIRATKWRLPIIHWWRQVTDARTRGGVQGLQKKYQGQGRLAAKVDLTGLNYNSATRRVTPGLNVVPGPVVKVEAVEAKISRRKLKRYVPVFQERAVDNDLLVQGQRNLEDYFQGQGYYDVGVDFRIEHPDQDTETIQYVISKGQRYKVVRLDIIGNKYFTNDMIRERMFIAPTAFNLRHGRYSEAFRKKDESNIADLYKANGFRDVVVRISAEKAYKGKTEAVAVAVNITEGPQWTVDTLTVDGIEKLNRDAVLSQITSVAGQPFAEVNLASDKNAVLTYYYQNGFPSATFKAGWKNSARPNHVDVLYTISEGDRQFVRDVITSGIHITRPSLLRREITLKPGDPLSPVHETNIQQGLYNLGIFARVDTAIQNPDGATDYKYVLYNFQEANRYSMNVGLGAIVGRFGTPNTSTLSGATGVTGFSPIISADVTRLNFLGLGHSVSFRGAYSTIDKLAAITYTQPRFRNSAGRTLTYTLLYNDQLNIRTFASRTESASVQLSQKFSKSLTGMFRIEYRRVSVSDVIIPVLLIPQFVQPVRLGIVAANFVWDRRNNQSNPSRGMYNTLDLALAAKYLGSQREFGRVLVRNATYYKLIGQWILARQTGFGIILPYDAPAGISAQESVPLPERFFGGGADSLRAFPYNQAGPRDTGAPLVPGGPSSAPTGFPLGGNATFFNNVELRFPLLGENIQGVFFHDMGNVFSSLSDVSFRFHQNNLQDFNYTVHAVGFGVRYRTPVGPIRVDLAYSINPPKFIGFSGTPDQLLNCNPNLPPSQLPSYCQSTQQSISHFQFFFSIGQTF
jgi:outer membrane protein insertion porin family